MEKREEADRINSSASENREFHKARIPLSATIQNAHAAGDGALGRDPDWAIRADEETDNQNESGGTKSPEAY